MVEALFNINELLLLLLLLLDSILIPGQYMHVLIWSVIHWGSVTPPPPTWGYPKSESSELAWFPCSLWSTWVVRSVFVSLGHTKISALRYNRTRRLYPWLLRTTDVHKIVARIIVMVRSVTWSKLFQMTSPYCSSWVNSHIDTPGTMYFSNCGWDPAWILIPAWSTVQCIAGCANCVLFHHVADCLWFRCLSCLLSLCGMCGRWQ